MVYDILVNFKKNAYEFYEWESKDEIKHIKQVPVFKVDEKTMLHFINYDLMVKKSLLDLINNKTEVYVKQTLNKIKYSCVLFDEKTAIAVIFDDVGKIIGKSKLLFDEEDDIIASNKDINITKIDYKVLKRQMYNNILTRKENIDVMLIIKYLDNIFENKKTSELNYLSYECFNKTENSYIDSYMKLKNKVIDNDKNVIDKIKKVLKQVKK